MEPGVNLEVANNVIDQFKGATTLAWLEHAGASTVLCRNPMVEGGSRPAPVYKADLTAPGSRVQVNARINAEALIQNILASHRQAVVAQESFMEEFLKLCPPSQSHEEFEADFEEKRISAYRRDYGDNLVKEIISVLEQSDDPYCKATCRKLNQAIAT